MTDVVLQGRPPAKTAAPEIDGHRAFLDYIAAGPGGSHALHLLVEGVHCGGCVRRIERALDGLPELIEARVNLSTRRMVVRWSGDQNRAGDYIHAVEALGFEVVPFDPDAAANDHDRRGKELLRALAVAGFAAGNVMLLSVAVWYGHGQGMDSATRDLLHWVSALVALPAVAFAGRPFFRSALSAIVVRRINMDVPISLAVLLAAGMSLVQTMQGAQHAYFDSSVTLLFFLLIGRYFDHRARGRVRQAAERLLALGREPAVVIAEDGRRQTVAASGIRPGMTLLVAAGARLPADGAMLEGTTTIDTSLLTGETIPVTVVPGQSVLAGALNTGAPFTMLAAATGEGTVLADIVRLVEASEQKRSRYVALADRLAAIYAPAVHGLAAGAFLGWMVLGGLDWQASLFIAIAVLIVTCPCALGLAVPAVQVVAGNRLMQAGVLLKSATALERLAEIDTVVFDKTGTLTRGLPELANRDQIEPEDLACAAALAANSRHPLARAVVRAARGNVTPVSGVVETPGQGLAANDIRLGSRTWCGVPEQGPDDFLELWLRRPGHMPVRFRFRDMVRDDAAKTVASLLRRGLAVEILSGDRSEPVAAVAVQLGIESWSACRSPADKCARLEELERQGRRVLFVGDGLNDAPALAAAHVSLSPSSAADISQNAADAVFQGRYLAPVMLLLETAATSRRLVRQNFTLSLVYNLATVPLAIAGVVTPLIAALAMSSSSLVVVGNALCAGWKKP